MPAADREIKRKISSVKSTQKITHAMELVAASKKLRAQKRMQASRPYAKKINEVIRHVALSNTEYRHPYLEKPKDIRRVGYIIVTSDRGLCGGLNINLFRTLLPELRQWQRKKVDVDLCLIGRKGIQFFRRFGGNVIAAIEKLGDAPEINEIIGAVRVMLNLFNDKKLDTIYLASNSFVNTMQQKPTIVPLLPLTIEQDEQPAHWDYIYEPDTANELLSVLLDRYIESQVYQAVVENNACFQAAQMIAMKNATDNAGELIGDLQLMYNKARQASITQEIAEITGGAAAIV